jgi:hypothetical protein
MIEKDLQNLKKSHTKSNKVLREISAWQGRHEKDDNVRFGKIEDAIKLLPTAKFIATKIEDAVKVTVNGKIDKIAIHLTEQDKNMEDFRNSLKPWDTTRNWLYETGKIILYIGGVATAVYAIIKLIMWLSTMK